MASRYLPDTPLGPVVACTVHDDFYEAETQQKARRLLKAHESCTRARVRRERGDD